MAKILIADDEPDVLVILLERLRRSGHDVDCASDGAKAIEMSEKSVYQLMIFDIRMPGYTGYEVCAFTKNSKNHSQTPVLLISAYPEEQVKWRESRADAFLAKPFEAGQLIATVDRLIKGNSN